MASNPLSNLTEEQYLSIERAAEFKSEFLDGVMYERSGVTIRHAELAGNILAELHAMLRDGECHVFGSDLRIRVSSRMHAYPDVSVVCGKPLLADEQKDVLLNPFVIIDVLSPTRERGPRFHLYRSMPSLREYMLVDENRVQIEQYTRDDAAWTLRDHQGLDAVLKLDSIGASLPLRLIYDGVDLES
jgi:Uma2 family endonuclease